MNNFQNILKEITEFTNAIETNYPELYRSLNENPITLPVSNNPKMDEKAMEDYLENLKQLLKNYIESQKSS